ncbi:MAG: tail fiber protein, partial [Bacteroidota bacterium]
MGQIGFLGEVRIFAGNFAPRGWALCEGQLLAISQNTALFSILGTIYGGDGRTTFALPDLRGRAPVSHGTGPGLPTYPLGGRGGNATTTLSTANLPAHNHAMQVQVNTEAGEETDPTTFLASSTTFAEEATANQFLGGVSVGNTGSNTAFSNEPPFLSINYIIATEGTFPSR